MTDKLKTTMCDKITSRDEIYYKDKSFVIFNDFYFTMPLNKYRCFYCHDNLCSGCTEPIIIGVIKQKTNINNKSNDKSNNKSNNKYLKILLRVSKNITVKAIIELIEQYKSNNTKKNNSYNMKNKTFVVCLPFKYQPALLCNSYGKREFIKAIHFNNLSNVEPSKDKILKESDYEYNAIEMQMDVFNYMNKEKTMTGNYHVEELNPYLGLSIKNAEKYISKFIESIEEENLTNYYKNIFMEVIDVSRFVHIDRE